MYFTTSLRIIILISYVELPSKKSSSNVVSVMMRCTATDPLASGSAEWLTEDKVLQTSV